MQQQCEQWLLQQPEHRIAWRRIQSIGQDFQSAHEAFVEPQQVSCILDKTSKQLQRRQALKILGIAALTGPLGWTIYQQPSWQADYKTATGQRLTITLADGTRLSLNTDTAIDVLFDQTQRLIKLHHGELYIESGADDANSHHRPLIVQKEHVLMEALGTRFVVRENKNTSYLQVIEGRVAIDPIHSTSTIDNSRFIVEAGQSFEITYKAKAVNITAHKHSGAKPLSWVEGMLVVDNIRLDDFLVELSRYRNGYLYCDNTIANLRLSGVFQLAHPEKILDTVARLLPIEIVSYTRWWVRVIASG